MKTIKFLAVVIFIVTGSISAFAQVSKEDADIIRAQFRKDKKDLVKETMNLTGPKADAFWKVYDGYEADRKKISDDRIAILNDYVKNYDKIDNKKASALTYKVFGNDAAMNSLQRNYYAKFSTAVGAKNAAKFFQLDNYITLIVRLEVQDNIPFIGELQPAKKSQ